MKNRKLVLIATAVMGFVALGSAGVATAAWYSAQAAQIAQQSGENTFTAANTTVTMGTLTLTLHIDNPTGNPGPTNTDGDIKIVVDGTPVDQADNFYDKTGSFTWYVTAALSGGSGAGGDGALVAALKEHADTYTVTFSGTNVKFGTSAAHAIANDESGQATFTINSSGIISVRSDNKSTEYFGVTEAQTEKGATITISGNISGGDIQ